MSGIIAFLSAQYDDAEAYADRTHLSHCSTAGPVYDPCDCGYPAFARADVASRRAILALHSPGKWNPDDDPEALHCLACTTDDDLYRPQMYPCQTVRHLAFPFAGEPGYDQQWRPE